MSPIPAKIGTKYASAGAHQETNGNLKPLDEFVAGVAHRLSGVRASRREVMMVEGEAYSLLGIFGVGIFVLYSNSAGERESGSYRM